MDKFYIGDIIKDTNSYGYITDKNQYDYCITWFDKFNFISYQRISISLVDDYVNLSTCTFREWELMNLVHYPNKALETKCEPILEFNEEIGMLLDRMKDVMLEAKGIGLAANQIGITKKAIVIKTENGMIHEMINPLILDTDGEINMREGCLSAPGIHLDIFRPEQITLQYQDRTGEVKKIVATGLIARTILHEVDHLQGITFFSKVSRNERKLSIKQLKKTLG